MNWRKPLFKMILHLNGYPIDKYMSLIESSGFMSYEQIRQTQDQYLSSLLLHAYQKVDYYRHILPEAGVIEDGNVNLSNFHKIPILTKDIIRREGSRLYSSDMQTRLPYKNSSGGSTGEPVVIMQDKDYKAWGLACRFVFNLWAGKDIGQPEIKLWGSERDILQGGEKLTTRLKRWLFNVEMLNTYKMSNEDMKNYIFRWNKVKPRLVWAYSDSMYKLSKFAESQNLSVYSPEGIICTTSALLPEMRNHIEKTFECKVYDQYGSREVGPIASECPCQQGLHVFEVLQKVEIMDSNRNCIPDGQMGDIIVTNLHNYSMPLIRYSIGDTASFATEPCSCGRGFKTLKRISGRKFSHFVKADGSLIHSQFFVGLLFFLNWVREFKIIQKDHDYIQMLIANEGEPSQDDMDQIELKIKQVMGPNCRVEFTFVDEVSPTVSGKYIYTYSEVEEKTNL